MKEPVSSLPWLWFITTAVERPEKKKKEKVPMTNKHVKIVDRKKPATKKETPVSLRPPGEGCIPVK